MRSKARRLKADNDIGLIIVDYLQLMQGPASSENRQQEISQISRSLKALAKELSVPVVALSQLSRAPEQRTGREQDGRSSPTCASRARSSRTPTSSCSIYRQEVYAEGGRGPAGGQGRQSLEGARRSSSASSATGRSAP